MNRRTLPRLIALFMMSGPTFCCAAIVADFDDLTLQPQQAVAAQGNDDPFFSRGIEFSRQWNSEFNCCPTGWAYSNRTDQITPGFENGYSAIVRSTGGGGFQSENFGVVSNLLRGEAEVQFPQAGGVQGMYVTNVTYTYRAVVDGNDGAGFVKGPFTTGDWLRLDVIGLDSQQKETGRVPVYLADYRDAPRVLDEWTWVDLRGLGNQVVELEFEMASTDVGPFGMNTPAMFAVDNLTFEPSATEGDFNRDGQLDAFDLQSLSDVIRSQSHAAEYDVTGDQFVSNSDLVRWVKDLKHTWLGDADLDGQFNSTDLVKVFQAGKYDQQTSSRWSEGDWNLDDRFDSGDLVTAFQDGGFEAGTRASMAAPEPSVGVASGAMILASARRMARCRWRRAARSLSR